MQASPRRVGVNEAAPYTGLAVSTLNKLRCQGGGPVFAKLGRRVIYSTDDLDDWVSKHRRASTSESPR